MAPNPTTLGFALLGLLQESPQSGYDLRKIFAATALGNYSSSPGAIYPALARLERARLVERRIDRARSLRPRAVYRPTAAGSAALGRWLTQDITREDVERRLDELMLRFAFLGTLEDPRATGQFLTALARELDEYVAALKRQRRMFPAGAPVHPRLALEAGIEQYLASARWAKKALRHFGGDRT